MPVVPLVRGVCNEGLAAINLYIFGAHAGSFQLVSLTGRRVLCHQLFLHDSTAIMMIPVLSASLVPLRTALKGPFEFLLSTACT